MWWNCYWWGKPFGLGPLAWLINFGLMGLFFWGIFYLFSRLKDRPDRDFQKTQEPHLILKKRFALGEISEEEFKKMKKEIEYH